MKKMKWVALVLTTAMAVGVFSGCNGSQSVGKDEKVQVTVSNWPNKNADPKNYELWEKRRAEFMEANPDIEIVPDEWQFDLKTFLPKAEGGTLPTIYQSFYTEAKKIKEFKYAADITQQAREYGFYDNINEHILDSVSENGKIYLIPQSVYTMGLFINMRLFREAGLVDENDTPIIPQTWEELAETSRVIKEKTGKAGFVFPSAENGGGWIFTVLGWSFGTNFMEQKDGKWVSTFASPEGVATLQYLKDLKWKDNVLPANAKINNAEVVRLLATDQAAMALVHSGQLDGFHTQYGMSFEDIAYAKLPAGPQKRVTLMGGGYFAFAPESTPEQIDAGFKWLKFMNQISSPDIDDAEKNRLDTVYKTRAEEGNMIIGVQELSIWKEAAPSEEYRHGLITQYANVKPNHVETYNDKNGIEYQVEEPVCAQDLYAILDSCIQEVFTKQDADSQALLQKASADFQSNFLDYEK